MLRLLVGLAVPLAVNSFFLPATVKTAVQPSTIARRSTQGYTNSRAVTLMAGAASSEVEQLLVKPIASFDGVIDLPGKRINHSSLRPFIRIPNPSIDY